MRIWLWGLFDINDFCSTRFKVYIHLPYINTQQRTTAPINNTHVISSINHRKIGLYQGSADHCELNNYSNIFVLLQPSHTIHFCNEWVLVIVQDLNIFIFSIITFDLIFRNTLVWLCLLHAIYLYTFTGLSFYIFCL